MKVCPNCTKENQHLRKTCESCGTNIENVANTPKTGASTPRTSKKKNIETATVVRLLNELGQPAKKGVSPHSHAKNILAAIAKIIPEVSAIDQEAEKLEKMAQAANGDMELVLRILSISQGELPFEEEEPDEDDEPEPVAAAPVKTAPVPVKGRK